MRIRSIKPEFWRSSDIDSLAWDDRLLFIGLWSYVDDNGVGRDQLSHVCADLFAGDLERDPSETFARVSRGLQKLFEAGRIVRYTVESKPYLEIVNWDRHQRIDKPNKERYPRSDASSAKIREGLASVQRIPAPGTEEQRNRGTEEQRTNSPSPTARESDFDEAYSHWPKKVARKAALEQFHRAVKKSSATELIEAVSRFGDAYAATTEKRFVPALDVWLRNERWTDELPVASNAPRMSKASQNAAAYLELYGGQDERTRSVQALGPGIS